MRLIDADNYKGKVIASNRYSGVVKVIRIDDVPTVDVNDFIIEELGNIKEFTEILKDNSKCKGCDKQPYDVFISLFDKRISELKRENIWHTKKWTLNMIVWKET